MRFLSFISCRRCFTCRSSSPVNARLRRSAALASCPSSSAGLAQLAASEAPVALALDAQAAHHMDWPAVSYDEATFRLALNEDAMASEKLAEGIRAFCVDVRKLEVLMQA